MADIFNLIPIIKAQELDSLSQPTFGVIDTGNQGGALATTLLSSTSTSTQIGQRFKVTIEIKTNDQQINQYKILVDFDSTKLSLIDQDTTVAGSQIKLLDTVFTVETPATDNTVSSGRITLIAGTPSGNGFSVNRNVAEIEFQAQQIGSANIKIVQGSVGSQLVRTNGTSLSFTPNELSVQISAQQVVPDVPDPPDPVIPLPVTPNPGVVDIPTIIPNTGIEDILPLMPLGAGIVLVSMGVVLLRGNPKKK